MKHLIIFFVLTLFLCACLDSKHERILAFHEVVNDIVENQIENPNPIIRELVDNHQQLSEDMIPDIRMGSDVLWSKSLFISLYDDGLIDSSDVDYMFEQVGSSPVYLIDSTKIKKKTIARKEIESLLVNVGYDSTLIYLKQKYNSRSILFLSKPIFSNNGDIILINADYYCGRLCGAQTLFLYKRKGKKWTLIYFNEYEKR